MTIILAIVLLCILITVHEFGHFIAARLTGIPVAQFAIGMGPKILSWKSKKYDTLFSLRLIPVGGFCAFVGEDDAEGKEAANPDAYGNHPVWKRLITVITGPLMNFALAFIVAVCYFVFTPVQDIIPIPDSVHVQNVVPGSPAEAAGILPEDQIIFVADIPIDLNDANTLTAAVNKTVATFDTFEVTVKRGEETRAFSLTPTYSETEKRYLLGVDITSKSTLSEPYRLAFGQGVSRAVEFCVASGNAVFDAIKMLFTRQASIGELSGPVGIVSMISEQTQTYGIQGYLSLLIMISINLGIMNLLPIPGLDGSRIIFMLIEAIRHKPIDQKKEAMVHLGGYLVLFGLFLLITYKDISRLFMGG